MTYYTVYKVTNKINGKFYIGTHKTKNLNDGYMGSGKYLLRSIEKHGLENFEKEILFVYDKAEEMFAKEAKIVNADFLAEENTYNLKIGGFGGFDYINNNPEVRMRYTKDMRSRTANHEKGMQAHLANLKDDSYKERYRAAISQGMKERYRRTPSHWIGRQHREDSKEKIGAKSKIHQMGTGNSQFGTCWIKHPQLGSKKIKRDEITIFIAEGWELGRKIK